MVGVEARCTECDHAWETRKSPEEIDRPRCSECGSHGEEIEFEVEAEEAETEEQSEVVEAARRDRRQFELLDRVHRLIDRLERTGPSESESFVAQELQGEHRELMSFAVELEGEAEPSLAELEAISDRVDELEAAVDEHAEELDRIERLADRVEELEAEEAELDAVVADLRNERDELRKHLQDVEDEAAAFEVGERSGWYDGKREFAIHVPCSICGGDMTVKPGSEMHQAVVDFFQRNGWGHEGCVNQKAEKIRS